MSETITDFLLARTAEDEALAQAAEISMHGERHTERWDYTSYVLGAERDSTEAQDMFIREFWPARVLAECAAKRAIILEHSELDPCEMDPRFTISRRSGALSGANRPMPCTTIRALASAYSDHPDYQLRWAA